MHANQEGICRRVIFIMLRFLDDEEGAATTCRTSEELMMSNNSTTEDHQYHAVENELESWGGDHVGDQAVELKEMLLKKYSGYLATLRKDFLKKRKKGKLPKDARSALLDWWNSHFTWPYPTVCFHIILAKY